MGIGLNYFNEGKTVECICQVCGEKKQIKTWTPKNEEATFRMFGLKGSHLPVCSYCVQKNIDKIQEVQKIHLEDKQLKAFSNELDDILVECFQLAKRDGINTSLAKETLVHFTRAFHDDGMISDEILQNTIKKIEGFHE